MTDPPPANNFWVFGAVACDVRPGLILSNVDLRHLLGDRDVLFLRSQPETTAQVHGLPSLSRHLRHGLHGDTQYFRRERLVEVSFGVLCVQIQCVRHLPQRQVHPQLDPAQVSHHNLESLWCAHRLAQRVGELWLVGVDARQVERVVAPARQAPSGVGAIVFDRDRQAPATRCSGFEELLNAGLQQGGFDPQARFGRRCDDLVVGLQQVQHALVRLGEGWDQLVRVGGGGLHRHLDTQLLKQCRELRRTG